MILDRYRLGQLRKSWRFRTSSLLLPPVVAVDHPLIRKKRSPIPRTGLAGSQAERNENGMERKKDGTELKRCENAVLRKCSHRRTIIRRLSNVNFLLTGHASFSFCLRFFGPCRRSSKDGKHSFVLFAIIVDREMYRVHVLEPMSYVLCTRRLDVNEYSIRKTFSD